MISLIYLKKLNWVMLLFLLPPMFGGCTQKPVNTMNSEIERLIDTIDDFDVCNVVFQCIGDRYDHMIVADKYSNEERVVMLVWHATGIIENGGFEYLFEGDFPGDPGFRLTAQAFEQINCEQAATAFREAMALFPNSQVPEDIKVRQKLYKSIPESVREKINEKFFHADWEKAGEFRLRHKLAEYIRKHKTAFAHLEWKRPTEND